MSPALHLLNGSLSLGRSEGKGVGRREMKDVEMTAHLKRSHTRVLMYNEHVPWNRPFVAGPLSEREATCLAKQPTKAFPETREPWINKQLYSTTL